MVKPRWKKKAEIALALSAPRIDVCVSGINDKVTLVEKKNGVYGWRTIDADDPGGIGEGRL